MKMEYEQIVDSLADTLMRTRAELDAMRTLFIAVLAEAAEDPSRTERLGQAIRKAIDGDAAVALNSQMSDEMLLQREQWMKRLTPLQIRQHAGLG